MKNKYFEDIRRKQRSALTKCRSGDLIDKVSILHIYNEKKETDLTWWDNFSIQLANRKLMVWFVHPRMQYLDMIRDEAHNAVEYAYPEDKNSMFGETTKIHRKVGKSRKKVVGYRSIKTSSSWKEYFNLWDAKANELYNTSNLVIKPSITLESTSWAQGINLIAPLVINSKEDVVRAAKLAASLYKKEVNIHELFSGYTYTREDWIKEHAI